MELSWTTFLLEIGNFLVLVWILKRFLYQPVRDAIERRRRAVADELAQAEEARSAALALEDSYRQRLRAWEQERARVRSELEREIAAERTRLLGELQIRLEQERDRARVLEDRRRAELQRRVEEQALGLAGGFASRLLGRLAGPEVEARLLDLLVEQLPELSADHRETLAAAARDDSEALRVVSAYPLSRDQQAALVRSLSSVAGTEVRCESAVDPELLAGLRIDAGPLVLRANLRDELAFFAEEGP